MASNYVTEAGDCTNLSASALVKTGEGDLLGVFCASSTSGTLKLWDNTSAAGKIIANTFTLAAGTFTPIPVHFQTGLYATIANTADITVMWK
jgi:hypothetical protein